MQNENVRSPVKTGIKNLQMAAVEPWAKHSVPGAGLASVTTQYQALTPQSQLRVAASTSSRS